MRVPLNPNLDEIGCPAKGNGSDPPPYPRSLLPCKAADTTTPHRTLGHLVGVIPAVAVEHARVIPQPRHVPKRHPLPEVPRGTWTRSATGPYQEVEAGNCLAGTAHNGDRGTARAAVHRVLAMISACSRSRQ